ncbi:hypothetical protein [Vibrio paucivorans]
MNHPWDFIKKGNGIKTKTDTYRSVVVVSEKDRKKWKIRKKIELFLEQQEWEREWRE